jgi:hypothetical protein
MSEAIVIQSPCAVEGAKVVCKSEGVESGPGVRTRLALEIAGRYRFTELDEIAWPNKEPEHYFTVQWTRSPAPAGWK